MFESSWGHLGFFELSLLTHLGVTLVSSVSFWNPLGVTLGSLSLHACAILGPLLDSPELS